MLLIPLPTGPSAVLPVSRRPEVPHPFSTEAVAPLPPPPADSAAKIYSDKIRSLVADISQLSLLETAQLNELLKVHVHDLLTTSSVVVNQYSYKNNHVFTNVGCLASWWFSYPGLPLHHWLIQLVLQAQILKEGAGLLQGSHNSVVRAPTAKVGGLGFNSQWLPMHFFFGVFLS